MFSGVACTAALGHFNKPQGLALPNGGGDGVVANAVFLKLSIGERKLSIVAAAMHHKLKFEAVEKTVRR
jgi:hypothetical protein